eukprot:7829142-Lingulodinium_polyedra.AAC.1
MSRRTHMVVEVFSVTVDCCGGRSPTAVYSCGAFVEHTPQQFTPVSSGSSTAVYCCGAQTPQ